MRSFSPTVISALESSGVSLCYAVEMFYDSGTVRIWTGVGNKTFNGEVYTGTGSLLSISDPEEGEDLAARGISITLSGIDSGLINLAQSEPYQGRVCKVYLGVNEELVEIFSGFMDVMMIQDSGESSTITLSVESKMMVLSRAVPLRYTSESHKSRYPNDTFFDYTNDLADREVIWGRKDNRPQVTAPPPL